MSQTISINGVEYFAPAFDLAGEAIRMKVSVAGDVHWMAKWKIGGRAAWYDECAKSQALKEHRILDWVNEFAICNCGFMAPDTKSSAAFYRLAGHIDTASKQTVTLFHVGHYRNNSKDSSLKYLCQSCGLLGRVGESLQADTEQTLKALDELRESHVCRKGSKQSAKG